MSYIIIKNVIMRNILAIFLVIILSNIRVAGQNEYKAIIPYQNSMGKLIVKASINGIEGNFVFDTGAPVSFTNSFAKKLGVKNFKKVQIEDSNGNVSHVSLFELPFITLGGVRFNLVKSLVLEKESILKKFGIDGVIGYTLFGGFAVQIDSRVKNIIIVPQSDCLNLDESFSCNMISNQYNLPLLNVMLNGYKDTVMFDSGDSQFYVLSEKFLERVISERAVVLLNKGEGVVSVGACGLESKTVKCRVKVKDFSLCRGRFKNVTSITTSASLSRLGSDIFNYGKVTIDYPNRKFYFEPFSNNIPDMYRKEWNVVLTAANNELRAGLVWGKMQKKIQVGAKIVEVNGKRFDNIDAMEAITKNIVNLRGDKALITFIDKKGVESKLKIKRE